VTEELRLHIALLVVSLIIAAQPYYYLWWFDLVTHLIVGITLSMVVMSIVGYNFVSIIISYKIAILWEIFEYLTKLFIIGYRDTLTDLLSTSVGFCIAAVLYLQIHERNSTRNRG